MLWRHLLPLVQPFGQAAPPLPPHPHSPPHPGPDSAGSAVLHSMPGVLQALSTAANYLETCLLPEGGLDLQAWAALLSRLPSHLPLPRPQPVRAQPVAPGGPWPAARYQPGAPGHPFHCNAGFAPSPGGLTLGVLARVGRPAGLGRQQGLLSLGMRPPRLPFWWAIALSKKWSCPATTCPGTGPLPYSMRIKCCPPAACQDKSSLRGLRFGAEPPPRGQGSVCVFTLNPKISGYSLSADRLHFFLLFFTPANFPAYFLPQCCF